MERRQPRLRSQLSVALDQRFMDIIDEGIKKADADQLIPHSDVVARVRSRGRPNELLMPEPATDV